MTENKGKLSEHLNTSQSWEQICHILADYLLGPYITILFGKNAQYPILVGHPEYKQVNSAAEQENKNSQQGAATNRRKEMNYWWQQVFPMRMVEFFKLRLLKLPYDTRTNNKMRTTYHHLFLDLLGDGITGRNFEQITIDYMDMLREYLSNNCPCLNEEERSLPIAELIKTVRKYYSGELQPNALWMNWNSHIKFERQPYAMEVIRLLDEVAQQGKKHPLCRYFLITSEYISGLFIYVYMIEFLICIGNRALSQGEKWKPNLIKHLQEYHFPDENS